MEVLNRNIVVSGLFAVAVAAACGTPLHAQTNTSEHRTISRDSVYAALVLNLTRFVRWPDSAFEAPDAPLVIGTFSNHGVYPALQQVLANETLERRPLVVREIKSLEDVELCHIVFLPGTDTTRLNAIIARCKDRATLTVSDVPGFVELGGHIMFDSSSSRIRLRISPDNLKRSHLSASSQLLRLAEIVNR